MHRPKAARSNLQSLIGRRHAIREGVLEHVLEKDLRREGRHCNHAMPLGIEAKGPDRWLKRNKWFAPGDSFMLLLHRLPLALFNIASMH
jgi:hypothetical protein